MPYVRNDALVSTEWLAEHSAEPDLKVIDGSWYLPTENRDPRVEYAEAHIPGAVYFDIDTVADTTSPLPHMFPGSKFFAEAVAELGISNSDRIVCYDGGTMSAAGRVWWMFRAFGHGKITILNGGSKKWLREDRPMEATVPSPARGEFEARLNAPLIRSIGDVLGAVAGSSEQILDARAAGRFNGTAPEPRAGMRSGHMPGACNLPYTDLLAEDGTVQPTDELTELFQGSGISLEKPVITSCGSGVSATVLLLGLYLLGHDGGSLYDGSWSEWGSRDDTPVTL